MRAPTRAELHEEAIATKSTEKRPLWAVAAEEFDPVTNTWGLIIRYNHAFTEGEARLTYAGARGVLPFKIVACAQAIGYRVMDNQGIRLSV